LSLPERQTRLMNMHDTFREACFFLSYLLWNSFCSSFVLDAFKRSYSNEDTVTKAIPFFWENFDKEGWSIWKAEYKYKEDLKRIFMSSNLVSGMFQRLDKFRKYGFGSVLILGVDNDNLIEGVWVMRGQELAFDVSCLCGITF